MNAPTDNRALAIAQPAPQRSIVATMANRFGMEPQAFEATLRATVCKNASREEFAALMVVANEYGLNPLTKELYAFPAKGGGIVPVVSVDGWARIINDHPQFDGMEFVDLIEDGKLVSVTCKMFRKDRSRPIEATEYMAECLGTTDVWKRWPRRMLRHKALIQCARYAFGFSGIYDDDEYNRMVNVTPAPQGSGVAARLAAREGATEGFNTVRQELITEDGEVIEDAQFEDGAEASGEAHDGQAAAAASEAREDHETGPSTAETGAGEASPQTSALQLVGPDFDAVGWAAEFNTALAGFATLADLTAAKAKAKAEGRFSKLKVKSQGIYTALVDAMNARAAELGAGQ